MTKEELLALKTHARIKYVGPKTLEEVFNKPTEDIPKIWKTKGMILDYAREYEDTGRWEYGIRKAGTGKKTISMSVYGGHVAKVDPADWVLVDKRSHVEVDTDYKYRRAYIKRTCSNFKHKFRSVITDYKNRMDRELGTLPLDKKLKLLMEIDNEYKKWFGIINMDPDAALAAIEKVYLGDEYESSTSQKDQ